MRQGLGTEQIILRPLRQISLCQRRQFAGQSRIYRAEGNIEIGAQAIIHCLIL